MSCPHSADDSVPYVDPGLPSRCKWALNADAQLRECNPHKHQPYTKKPKILGSILEQVGETPLVSLKNIAAHYGLKCELLAKCEYFNAGGSVKDRIGLRMVEDAERDGLIRPGFTIIEPTSGNTGIGLALASAVKGYRCIIVMPEKMSNEKVNVLRALGAEIIRTPTSARYDAPNSHIRVAQKLQHQIPDSIILDQYRNPANPLAHYDSTAAEIIEQTDGKLDYMVCGAGTGGTVTGIGKRIKEEVPDCVVVGVDPLGSILAEPEVLNKSDVSFYEVEGIGYDFIPTVLDRTVVDKWLKMDDKRALEMARNLIRMEGILCGGSSGTAVAAAVEVAKDLPAGKRVVVLLPDGVRNYMTKFLDDDWMDERNLEYPTQKKQLEKPWYYSRPIEDIFHGLSVTTISERSSCINAVKLMKRNGFDQLPVVNETTKHLLGMVTVSDICAKISAGVITMEDVVSRVLINKFPVLKIDENIGALMSALRFNPYAVIVDAASTDDVQNVSAIATHIDILDYLGNVDQIQQ